MAITNRLTKQVDLPVWEWMRFAPVTTSNLTALTTTRDGSDRYLYYFGSNVLYRYDTWGDSWQQLSTNATPVGALAVQHVKNTGFRGQVLAVPSSNQLRIPSTSVKSLVGYTIQIISGTGAGQERTITAVNDETIHESGVVTTATTSVLTDTTRKWKTNQWLGYALRVVFNTGFSQYRNILYNSENSATVADANYDGRAPWQNAFSSNAPYAAPNATAGTQAHFAIASQVITVDSAWTVTPDSTSKFAILSGGIWWITQNASSPFFNFYFYDLLSDSFINVSNPANLFSAALSTDWGITPLSDKLLGNLATGTGSAATSKTLVDSTKSWTKGQYNEFSVKITSGSGAGQTRRIISTNPTTLTISPKWDTNPDSSSTYAITSNNEIILAGNGRAQLLEFNPVSSIWSTGNIAEWGLCPSTLALVRSSGRVAFAASTANRVTNGITAVNATPTAAGTGYSVGDLLTISTGGTLGRVYVESINPLTGAVLSVSLYTAGSGYTIGTGKAVTGGTGTGCTIEITTVGTIGVITTSINHDMVLGETFTFAGATEAAWNTSYSVLGIQSATIIEVIITATTNAAALYAQATSLLVDATKNWTPNEFAGKLLGIQSNGLAGAINWRRILGNSTNTITFTVGTAATNGNSRYFIQDLEAFGKDKAYLADTQGNQGYPTSGSVGLIVDTSKSWYPGSFNGNKIEIQNSDGTRMEDFIVSNTTSSISHGITVMGGAGTNTLAWSADNGITWTGLGTSIFSSQCYSIAWSGKRFVAVGSGTNTIAYSEDGKNWTGLGLTTFGTFGITIAWNGVRFVAGGGTSNTLAWSNDGVNWTGLGTTVFPNSLGGIAWNGTRWVAAGDCTNGIAYSSDGITWTTIATPIFTTSGRGVCWTGTQFVATGQGTNTIATSPDGITWTGLGTSIFSTAGWSAIWNGSVVVATGQGTNTIAYSTDSGSTWTGLGTSIFSTTGRSVLWNGTNFVAGGVGTNGIAYSATGTAFTGSGTSILTAGYGGASTTPFNSLVPNIGVIPDSSSYYRIMDSYGDSTSAGSTTTLNDATKKWKVNQWAGKRCLITAGTGYQQEFTITSNTATQLSFSTITTAPDTTSTYTILGVPARGAGIQPIWNFGTSDSGSSGTKGEYLFVPRGGASHTIDRYNISTNMWTYGSFILGQGETLTTGTMYAYDGDRIYFQKDATGRIMYYDILKNEINAFGTIPYGMSTAILSNRMEIIQTADGLKYLYVMRHSGTEMWRTIIYF